MTEPSRPKYREHLYPQPAEDKPLTPDQARAELGWKLVPETKDYGHDD
ncbi:hypothetical protein ACHMW6_06330 [Pseudoduganella sp. UC29_106]